MFYCKAWSPNQCLTWSRNNDWFSLGSRATVREVGLSLHACCLTSSLFSSASRSSSTTATPKATASGPACSSTGRLPHGLSRGAASRQDEASSVAALVSSGLAGDQASWLTGLAAKMS
ncbi:unnamed protein product, partial [Protopolystoma xenopodis]